MGLVQAYRVDIATATMKAIGWSHDCQALYHLAEESYVRREDQEYKSLVNPFTKTNPPEVIPLTGNSTYPSSFGYNNNTQGRVHQQDFVMRVKPLEPAKPISVLASNNPTYMDVEVNVDSSSTIDTPTFVVTIDVGGALAGAMAIGNPQYFPGDGYVLRAAQSFYGVLRSWVARSLSITVGITFVHKVMPVDSFDGMTISIVCNMEGTMFSSFFTRSITEERRDEHARLNCLGKYATRECVCHTLPPPDFELKLGDHTPPDPVHHIEHYAETAANARVEDKDTERESSPDTSYELVTEDEEL